MEVLERTAGRNGCWANQIGHQNAHLRVNVLIQAMIPDAHLVFGETLRFDLADWLHNAPGAKPRDFTGAK